MTIEFSDKDLSNEILSRIFQSRKGSRPSLTNFKTLGLVPKKNFVPFIANFISEIICTNISLQLIIRVFDNISIEIPHS